MLFGQALLKYFAGKNGSSPLEKLTRKPTTENKRGQLHYYIFIGMSVALPFVIYV